MPRHILFLYTDNQQVGIKKSFSAVDGLPNIIGAPDPFPFLNQKLYTVLKSK